MRSADSTAIVRIGEMPRVPVDQDYVHHILINLLVNAQHAIGETGAPELFVRIVAGQDGGSAVFIEITDIEPSVPEPLHARLLEPVFTTKLAGQEPA